MIKKIWILTMIICLSWLGCSPKQTQDIDPSQRLDYSYTEFSNLLSKSTPKAWANYENKVVTWQGEIEDIIEDNMDKIIKTGEKPEISTQNLVCINLKDNEISLYTDDKTALSLNRNEKIQFEGKIKAIEKYQNTQSILLLALSLKQLSRNKIVSLMNSEKKVTRDISILTQRLLLTSFQQNQLLESLINKEVIWQNKIDRLTTKGTQSEIIINFDIQLRLILAGNPGKALKSGDVIKYKAKVTGFNNNLIPAVLELELLEIL